MDMNDSIGAPGQPPQPTSTPYPSQPPTGSYPAPGYPAQPPTVTYPGQQPGAPYPGQQPPGGAPYPGQQPPGGAPYPGQQPPGGAPYPGQQPPGGTPYPGQQPAGGGYPAGQPGGPPYPGQPPAGGGYAPGQPGMPGGVPPGGIPPAVGPTADQFGRMNIQGGAGAAPRGTIRPIHPFNAEKDAEIIRKAMKGMGTDEKAIIGVISTRSNQQRQEIMKMFKTMYGKDIIQDLKSELSGDFRETIMALFTATTYYDAWSLNNAMLGIGTKESVLIEILCTRTNAEIRQIVQCYQQYFHRSLEKDIVDDTSGHFKRLLVSCTQANRSENPAVDMAAAQQDAQALYQAGEKKFGTDESTFLRIMAVKHHNQLRATFDEYVKISGRDILSSIDREMSGDLKEGMKALVMSAKNRPEYFADKLYHAMKGAGTQDSTLIRIVVSRSEIDLQDIKEVYLFKYHKTLATAVSSDTSGDYKRLLLAVVGQ